MRGDTARTGSAVGLSVLGATCCALPATLVALGAGGAVASLASAAPWLVALSRYKGITFTLTAAVLAWAFWQAGRADACDLAHAARLRRQRRLLRVAAGLWALSTLSAYALLPWVEWWSG